MTYNDTEAQAELMNRCFQSVVKDEGDFEDIKQGKPVLKLAERIKKKAMESLDVRKSTGPDAMLNCFKSVKISLVKRYIL